MPPTSLPIVPAESNSRGLGQTAARGEPRRVLLICPPYQHLHLSSLATAHLASFLRQHEVPCTDAYLHFELARRMGPEKYARITDSTDGLSGELLFAEALHGRCRSVEAERKLETLFGSRTERESLLSTLEDWCVERLRDERPQLVGLTTSFNQLLSSLWLARCIKRQAPDTLVVLGGSACAKPMGPQIAKAYPDVDWVIGGHGEPALLALAFGQDPEPGFFESHASPVLDSMPIPDYSAFMRDAGEFKADPKLMLTFESSRGCWWGQKTHCTFCGLNGLEMPFSQKSSERVVKEIRSLWELYARNLFATDSILSREHLKRALPELAKFGAGPKLFYEVKANMTEAEVGTLERAHVLAIQPGIESLSTRLLGLLRKGVSAIQNLALLKWSRERGIAVEWNQLCAIPGESIADYEEQLILMRKIPHFSPPHGANPIRIDRYSPYFQDFAAFGWEDIEPLVEYNWLHPQLEQPELREMAYHFRGVGGVSSAAYLERFEAAIRVWKVENERGDGLFLDPVQGLVRNSAKGGFRFETEGLLDRVLECTHEVTSVTRVVEHARCDLATLEELARHGILYLESQKALNLSVRTSLRNSPADIACS